MARRENVVITLSPGGLTQYDPDKGLKTVAIATAAESHFSRAKNADRLFEAIEAKLTAQREYIIWRDTVQPQGRPKLSTQSESFLPAADPGHKVAHRWRKNLKLEQDFNLTLEDTKERCRRFCEGEKNVRGVEGTGENEWYTPEQYLDLAREVLGEIDLDPATSISAQQVVKAKTFFTKEQNGLNHDWTGRVWLNPPYAQPLISEFVHKMVGEYRSGRMSAGIMLTHNYTDTAWFQESARTCSAICFTRGRVQFYDADGVVAAPTQGQAFAYFGGDVARFANVFAPHGFVTELRK